MNLDEIALPLLYAKSGDYLDLIAALRNKNYQLNMTERRFLADLLQNAKITVPGRSRHRAESPRVGDKRLHVARYVAYLQYGCDLPRKKALGQAADHFYRSISSVEEDISFAKKKGMWRAYCALGRTFNESRHSS